MNKNYKIRKYSIAWWLMYRPLQGVIIFLAAFTAVIFFCFCFQIGMEKTEAMDTAYAASKPSIKIEEKVAEIEENEADYTSYDIPLSDELQDYTIAVAQSYGVDVEIVLAVMSVESNYKVDAVGDSGNSLGLMQIQPRWNKARMQRLGITDLLDPEQNILCGVDILSELIGKYGDVERALVVYNMGEAGSKGRTSTAYSQKVIRKAVELI